MVLRTIERPAGACVRRAGVDIFGKPKALLREQGTPSPRPRTTRARRSASRTAPPSSTAPTGTISKYHIAPEEASMSISASEARKTLFPLIERVNADRDAVEIVSRKGNAVLMPADEYAAWQETAYLFRSPANARRLLDAYERAGAGSVEEHALDRLDGDA